MDKAIRIIYVHDYVDDDVDVHVHDYVDIDDYVFFLFFGIDMCWLILINIIFIYLFYIYFIVCFNIICFYCFYCFY
jgi:hypothetical protein